MGRCEAQHHQRGRTARTSAAQPWPKSQKAITKIADHDVLFVHEPDGHFVLHNVTRGRSAGGKIEIIAGLRAGEHVVSEGVFTLKSAVLKSTFGEED